MKKSVRYEIIRLRAQRLEQPAPIDHPHLEPPRVEVQLSNARRGSAGAGTWRHGSSPLAQHLGQRGRW